MMDTKIKDATRVRLGDCIELCDSRNKDGHNYPFMGVNKNKDFMPTVADANELDNTKYKVVRKGIFVYSGMQTGRDVCIRLALYNDVTPIIVSPAYSTFKVKKENLLLPQFLFLFFYRYEMDRFGWFLSDSSIRSNLDWDKFCDIEIPLPSIEVQRELVAVYDGLQKIVADNEALIPQLEAACHAFVVDCQRKYPKVRLGDWIEISQQSNSQDKSFPFFGINKAKEFMPTVANTEGVSRNKYLIVKKGLFVFSGMQTGRDVCIRAGLYNAETPILISPAYTTFRITSPQKLLPDFLMLQFKRDEMDRLGWFKSDGSIRSNLDWDRFCEIEIPLPPIEIQHSIAAVSHCLEEARRIVRDTWELMKNLCPALVQKAAHSA